MIPGYFSFVQGEATPEDYAKDMTPQLHRIFYGALYEMAIEEGTYATYRFGLNRLVDSVKKVAQHLNYYLPNRWLKCLYHFYNRQLIVQMTSHPQRFEENFNGVDVPLTPISVPLERHPAYEIQIDMLQLLPHQLEHNFELKFLVVIVETFSRFVWAFPVSTTESRKVAAAFTRALSRPGLPLRFYEYLRDKLKRVLVDGGSEFKDAFRDNLRHVFPNATLVVSAAKRTTLGRPTSNGPIEAAIRTLRRVMRDYELRVGPGFYHSQNNTPQEGLERILKSYNAAGQTETLTKVSPMEIVTAMLEDNQGPLNDLQEHMDKKRKSKMMMVQEQRQQTGSKFLITNNHGYEIYRLYLKSGAFTKEVDFRVSLETYYISRFHPGNEQNVDLTNAETGAVLPNQRMSNLVLVKHPIMRGPPEILRNLKHEYDVNRFQPADRAQATKPYEVSEAIIRAVGGHPLLPAPGQRNQIQNQNQIQIPNPGLGALPAPPQGIHPQLRAPAPLVPPNAAAPPLPPRGFYNEPVDNEPTRRSMRERRGVDRLRY